MRLASWQPNRLSGEAFLNQPSPSSGGLGFHIDDAVGGPVVTVRSAETGEVVVRVAHNIEKMKGLIFNSKI